MYASGVDVECYNVWLYSRISWGQDNIHSYFDLIQFVQTISTKVCRILLCFFLSVVFVFMYTGIVCWKLNLFSLLLVLLLNHRIYFVGTFVDNRIRCLYLFFFLCQP